MLFGFKKRGNYISCFLCLFLGCFLLLYSIPAEAAEAKKGDTVTDGTFTYIILKKAGTKKDGMVSVYGLNKNTFNDKDKDKSNDSPKKLEVPARIRYREGYYDITATGSSGKATLAGKSSKYQYYWGNAEKIILPETITSIGDNSFAKAKKLKEVVIPSKVEAIGGEAFSDTDLKKIAVPASVEYIGRAAFWKCNKLKTITFEKGIGIIGKWAFQESGLKKVVLPEGLMEIKQAAFSKCLSLKQVSIPSSVSSIGAGVFSGCENLKKVAVNKENMTYQSIGQVIYTRDGTVLVDGGAASNTLKIEDGVETIGKCALESNKKLTELIMPSSVKLVKEGAFLSCIKLKKVVIGNKVTKLGASSFAKCSALKKITIPNGVKRIEKNAFYQNTSMNSLELNEGIKKIEAQAFAYCNLSKVLLPESMEVIGNAAFQGNKNLQEIYIPASVKEISDNVFVSCQELTKLRVSEENESYYCDINGALMNKSKTKLIAWPSAEGDIVVSDTITVIGSYALQDTKINSLIIPASVFKIEEGAFANCKELLWVQFEENEVILPSKIKNEDGLDLAVFYGCFALQTVSAPQIDKEDQIQKVFSERLKAHMDKNGVLAWLEK